jgi:broad specificity phosphatase PhoE
VRAVIASPLLRTRQTARAIADELGLDVTEDGGWVETAFGEWDGLTYGEIVRRWPQEMAAWQGSVSVAPPRGEALADHRARISVARRSLVADNPGRTVVVVAHTTPIRCVVSEALDAGDVALWRLRIDPGSLTVVRYWSDGGAEVLTVNHAAGR